jgi:hypothetical protein
LPSAIAPAASQYFTAICAHHRSDRRPWIFSVAVGHSFTVNTTYFFGSEIGAQRMGTCAMHKEVTKIKADKEIISFDVPDELLERAANDKQRAFTLAFCTSHWDNCGLPLVARYRRQLGDTRRDPLFERL